MRNTTTAATAPPTQLWPDSTAYGYHSTAPEHMAAPLPAQQQQYPQQYQAPTYGFGYGFGSGYGMPMAGVAYPPPPNYAATAPAAASGASSAADVPPVFHYPVAPVESDPSIFKPVG